jgi:hypothetical protein
MPMMKIRLRVKKPVVRPHRNADTTVDRSPDGDRVIGHREQPVCTPDGLAAWHATLHMVDRTLAFVHQRRIKPGGLKLAVNIARKHTTAMRLRVGPFLQHRISRMRDRIAV